jgi:AcrB/AcrD/AcrF family
VVERYNGFPAAKIVGSAAPGHASGEAIAAMEQVMRASLPTDFSYDWTGTAYQEKRAGSSPAFAFGAASSWSSQLTGFVEHRMAHAMEILECAVWTANAPVQLVVASTAERLT